MAEQPEEILLVEDSADDVAFFTHTLQKAGLAAHLRVMRDGAEALEFVFRTGRYADHHATSRPKIIILDLKLPKVDGLEVLRRLKGDPVTRLIPIVVLSSSQEERDLVESYGIGANSYVVKPMDFNRYSESVRLLGQYWLHCNQTPNC
jgi:two-component system response regulator